MKRSTGSSLETSALIGYRRTKVRQSCPVKFSSVIWQWILTGPSHHNNPLTSDMKTRKKTTSRSSTWRNKFNRYLRRSFRSWSRNAPQIRSRTCSNESGKWGKIRPWLRWISVAPCSPSVLKCCKILMTDWSISQMSIKFIVSHGMSWVMCVYFTRVAPVSSLKKVEEKLYVKFWCSI